MQKKTAQPTQKKSSVKAQKKSTSETPKDSTPTPANTGRVVLDDHITIHEKSRGETINVYIADYAGKTYLHIREWYLDKDQSEKPTKKGVAIPIEKADALRKALDKLLPKSK